MSKLHSIFTRTQARIVMMAMLIVMAVSVQAQDTIEVPMDDILMSINSWLETLVPVVAIGLGITGSILILSLVRDVIIKNFRGK